MSSLAVAPHRESVSPDPMEMIRVAFDAAIKQGSAMEVVTVILEQQKWIIQHNEEAAFNDALKRMQRKLQKIPKRGYNKETKSHFPLAADIDNEIQKLLDEENMTLSFEPAISDKPDNVLIIGTLSLGAFTKRYPLDMPADGKGAKGGGVMSRTHATGSAITYAKRYLKDMIFDLRFASIDDDGNGGKQPLEETVVIGYLENIRAARTEDELKNFYLPAQEAAQKAGDERAMFALEEEKKKAWKRIKGGVR